MTWSLVILPLGITSFHVLDFQVPPFLVRKVFTQIFSFINVQLFNRFALSVHVCACVCLCECMAICLFVRTKYGIMWNISHNLCSLLLRRECCSFSNGEYVKAGLSELELWCYDATEEVSTLQSFVSFNFPASSLYGLPIFFVCSVCRFCLGWVEAY